MKSQWVMLKEASNAYRAERAIKSVRDVGRPSAVMIGYYDR